MRLMYGQPPVPAAQRKPDTMNHPDDQDPNIDATGHDYVLAPPSRHKSGKTYSWQGDLKPGRGPCAEIPASLLEAITRRAGTRPHDDPVPEGNYPPLEDRIKRAKAYIQKMPEAIQGEYGSTTTFLTAMRLVRGFALPQGVAYDILAGDYNPRCVPPWSADELSRKIDEALVSGQMEYGACFRDDDKRAVERELARVRARQEPGYEESDGPPCNEGYDGPNAADMTEAIARSSAAQVIQEEGPPSPPEPPSPPQGDGGGDDGGRIFHDFLVGDHVEVAEAVVDHLERGGRTVIHEEGAVAALTPWDGSEPLMVAAYGLAPTPVSPRDLNPLLRPLTPAPTIPADQVVKGDHGIKIPTGSKPSPSSVVVAITYVRQHFNLVLPPQDSRIQALAILLDFAAEVGSAR